MNKECRFFLSTLFIISLFLPSQLLAQEKYKSSKELGSWAASFTTSNSKLAKIQNLTKTTSGKEFYILEIGTEINKEKKSKPAILVVANMNGLRPLTTEAAINLSERIVSDQELYKNYSWYILPMGNPEAADRYFDKVKLINAGNLQSANNDLDENTDEDDFNDLNNDGFITMMRKKDPQGTMIPVSDEPRLMRKADKKEGEVGIYKIYSEGIDDDRDGKYNEDGQGGTNVNLNFPHLFDHFNPETGLYPGSAPESRAIIEFVFRHPEIAMAFAFGETNFCLFPPKGGRKGEVDLSSIKIPERFASMLGADKDKSYSMQEIIEMVKPIVPAGMEVNESLIASFLGLGAVVNPLPGDLEIYNKFTKDYKGYLKEKGVESERFEAARAKEGSFELWAYYHLGVPVFSMDLFSLNKPEEKKEEGSGLSVESLEKMSTEEFFALGEDKINRFLKESGAPAQFNAKTIISMMESGQADPARMASMMKQMPKPEKDEKGADPEEKAMLEYSDQVLQGKGFVNWEKFDHPSLGEVEIGGFIPYLATTPPYEMTDSLLDLHIPWIFTLVDQLPDLKILETKLVSKGSGIYMLEVWIENNKFIPFPTAMGERNSQPAPAIILLEAKEIELLEGYKRTSIKSVPGYGRVKKTWLIKADRKEDLTIKLESQAAGNDIKKIKIGG